MAFEKLQNHPLWEAYIPFLEEFHAKELNDPVYPISYVCDIGTELMFYIGRSQYDDAESVRKPLFLGGLVSDRGWMGHLTGKYKGTDWRRFCFHYTNTFSTPAELYLALAQLPENRVTDIGKKPIPEIFPSLHDRLQFMARLDPFLRGTTCTKKPHWSR